MYAGDLCQILQIAGKNYIHLNSQVQLKHTKSHFHEKDFHLLLGLVCLTKDVLKILKWFPADHGKLKSLFSLKIHHSEIKVCTVSHDIEKSPGKSISQKKFTLKKFVKSIFTKMFNFYLVKSKIMSQILFSVKIFVKLNYFLIFRQIILKTPKLWDSKRNKDEMDVLVTSSI